MTFTVTFIATVFFSRTLTSPIQRLMVAMEQVREGRLDAALNIRSRTRDEIAVLSQVFNEMTHDLRQSRDALEEINRDLEQKVIERTAN
jgi:nitrogen fixation/metabolism regulation signal transduction histidine kinase